MADGKSAQEKKEHRSLFGELAEQDAPPLVGSGSTGECEAPESPDTGERRQERLRMKPEVVERYLRREGKL
jgi:hypothetical protein